MQFDKLVESLLRESYTDATPQQVAERFMGEVLGNYEYDLEGKHHLNSNWVSKMFCKWIQNYGIGGENATVILFVPPQKEVVKDLKKQKILPKDYDNNGEPHICPIFKNNILDFTIGRFIPKRELLVTPIAQWKNVYGKYGYGTNTYKGQEIFMGTYNTVAEDSGIENPDKFAPKRKF
jgi:hypothetical protein